MIVAIIPPADALFADVYEAAIAHGMHIITDGCRIVVSSIVPAGWKKLAVIQRSNERKPS